MGNQLPLTGLPVAVGQPFVALTVQERLTTPLVFVIVKSSPLALRRRV